MYQRHEASDETFRIIRELKSLERKYPVLTDYLQATTARSSWGEQVLHMAQQWAALSLGLSASPRIADVQARFGGNPAHVGVRSEPVLGGDGIPILRTPIGASDDFGVAEPVAQPRSGVNVGARDRYPQPSQQQHDRGAPLPEPKQADGSEFEQFDSAESSAQSDQPVRQGGDGENQAAPARSPAQGKAKAPPSLKHLI